MSSNRQQSANADATGGANDQWSSVSKHVFNSCVEANNAVLAAMGFSPGDDETDDAAEPTTTEPSVSAVAYGDETWVVERSSEDPEALCVGDYVQFMKPIAAGDVSAFAQATGDTNRLHLAPEFAEQTQFDGRIAHGTLVAGTISAALARFPGLTVYLSQDLEFHAPVEIGSTVTAAAEIVEALGDSRYRLHTTVETADETTVIEGEAVVIIQPEPS